MTGHLSLLKAGKNLKSNVLIFSDVWMFCGQVNMRSMTIKELNMLLGGGGVWL